MSLFVAKLCSTLLHNINHVTNILNYSIHRLLGARGGARGGLGGYSPPAEHAGLLVRRWKRFFGDFWHLYYHENHILAPSSEESAPHRQIPGATPVGNLFYRLN